MLRSLWLALGNGGKEVIISQMFRRNSDYTRGCHVALPDEASIHRPASTDAGDFERNQTRQFLRPKPAPDLELLIPSYRWCWRLRAGHTECTGRPLRAGRIGSSSKLSCRCFANFGRMLACAKSTWRRLWGSRRLSSAFTKPAPVAWTCSSCARSVESSVSP